MLHSLSRNRAQQAIFYGLLLFTLGTRGGLAATKRRPLSEKHPQPPPSRGAVSFLQKETLITAPATAVSTDPAVVGVWSGAFDWPKVAVHSILMYTGKVLWFRGDGDVPTSYTWDPATNVLSSQPTGYDVFCAGHSQLPDGRILVTGGAYQDTANGPNYVNIFDPATETWSTAPSMRNGRYYPTNVAMGDGRTAIFAGTDPVGNRNLQVEIFNPLAASGAGIWDLVAGADKYTENYPRYHLLPNGLLLRTGIEKATETLDPVTGTWRFVANSNYGVRLHGNSVQVPPSFTKFLIVGGYDERLGDPLTTNTAEIIDMADPTPHWTTIAPMSYRRSHSNAVILPDGKILVAGGGQIDDSMQPVMPAEIFDPATSTWTVVASMNSQRLYHSSALLLPDGRCLWAGTNGNHTAELYSPPYLFKGARPSIGTIPVSVNYGQAFTVQSPEAANVTTMIFMRPGATTHSENMDQRYVPLTFTHATATTLGVTAPSQPNIAPPGYYMLFLLDANGIPSVAKFIKLGGAAPGGGGNQPPQVGAGSPQTITLPASANLAGSATDDGLPAPPSLTVTWSKDSGPGNVTFGNLHAAATSASFSAAGSYVLRLTANDGALSASATTAITVLGSGGGSGGSGTLDLRVNVKSDDAEEGAGVVSLTSSDLELTKDGGILQTVGLRFNGLTIPQGATIASAWVQFKVDEVQSEATPLTFRGQAADNPGTFTTAASNVSSRPTTTASVAWSPVPWSVIGEVGPNEKTPSLVPILQELVNRPGWASGNSVVLIITGSGHRTAVAWDGEPAGAPLLHVEFGSPQAANQPPYVDAGSDQTITRPSSANVSATITDDGLPQGSSLTQTWSVLSGGGSVAFGNPNAAATTASFSAAGTYVLRLTASDGALTGSDDVNITVLDPASGGTIESRTTASSDDAEEKLTGSVSLTSSDLELVDDAGIQTVGVRFNGIAVPQGAHVTSAWIQFDAKELQSEPTSLVIQAQAADNALTFTTTKWDVSGRPRTAASASWLPAPWDVKGAGAAQKTPDLTALIQEVVNRPGWQSGNSLAIVITGTGHRTAFAADGDVTKGPLLHVEFGGSGGAVNHRPVVNAGSDQTVTLTTGASLSGSVSDDGLPAGGTLTVVWGVTSGPSTVNFTSPITTSTGASFTSAGTYVLTLTADDEALTASDDVTINVVDSGPVGGGGGTVESRVAAKDDDAEEQATGTVSLTSSDLELVKDGTLQTVGMRFRSISIPRGATITKAYIQFTVDEAKTEITALSLQGQSSDNASPFTTALLNISSRSRTTASVPWVPVPWTVAGEAGPNERTPDLSPVIQEIVSRSGWVSGNALAIIVTGTGRRTATAFDGVPGNAPLLHVEFR